MTPIPFYLFALDINALFTDTIWYYDENYCNLEKGIMEEIQDSGVDKHCFVLRNREKRNLIRKYLFGLNLYAVLFFSFMDL